jgi:hypothetical protein
MSWSTRSRSSDIDRLKIFKFYKHPEIRDQIEVMKGSQTVQRYRDSRTCCIVLTNSPNSCPTESLFSIFNTTYNDDQKSFHTDYIELSM